MVVEALGENPKLESIEMSSMLSLWSATRVNGQRERLLCGDRWNEEAVKQQRPCQVNSLTSRNLRATNGRDWRM